MRIPRWELIYRRAFKAAEAALQAKEEYQQVQTPEAQQAAERKEALHQAALEAAEAAAQVWRQQGRYCPTYDMWSRQERGQTHSAQSHTAEQHLPQTPGTLWQQAAAFL